MSGRRAMRRKRCFVSKSGASSPTKAVSGSSQYFEDDVSEPLEFGVIEVKSEVEEIVLTSQIGEIASLVVSSVDQGTGVVTAGSSAVAISQDDCCLNVESPDGRYSCGMCAKQFGRQAALKRHMESHKQEPGKRARTQSAVACNASSPFSDALGRTVTCKDGTMIEDVQNQEHSLTHDPKKSHLCLICSKAFGSRSHLAEHVRIHTGEKPYVCATCDHSFASPSNLRKHLRFHRRRMPYVCSFCLQSYETEDLLNAHLLIHKGFLCPECNDVLSSRDDLERHRLKHGVQNDTKCTSCGQRFANLGDLLAHHETHVEPDVFVCSVCRAVYQYPSVLRQHMAEHASRTASGSDEPLNVCLSENVIDDLVKSKQAIGTRHLTIQNNNTVVDDACNVVQQRIQHLKNENDRSCSSDVDLNREDTNLKNDIKIATDEHVCDVCQANFKTISELLTHRLTSHSTMLEVKKQEESLNSRSKFICLYCSKPFAKRYSLEQHERVHSGERPFSCETCGLAFKQQSQLFKHSQKHSGLKPFVCNYCKKAFSQASYLTEHKRQHTNERPYGCEVCGNRFRTNGALRVHNRQHTGAMPYMCEVCNRRFKQKANLQKHVQIHTNIRSHNCEMCGKGFTDSQALKRHVVMHTGDRPYVCQLCGKTFPAQSSLTIHMKFHRGERKHKCHLCEKAFVVKSHLNRHLNTHGKRDGSVIFGQESVASNYIPIDDDFIIADSFQVEEVVQTS